MPPKTLIRRRKIQSTRMEMAITRFHVPILHGSKYMIIQVLHFLLGEMLADGSRVRLMPAMQRGVHLSQGLLQYGPVGVVVMAMSHM